MRKLILIGLMVIISLTSAHTQDLRGGEMIITQLSPLVIDVHLTLYQQISTYINRPKILIDWGDSSPLDTCFGGFPVQVTPGIYKSGYIIPLHVYSSYGNYIISVLDSFRISNIQNISASNNEKFYIQNSIFLSPSITNNSVQFGNDQTEIVNTNGVYSHNPLAFDQDGDSLYYSLTPCYTSNYTYPTSSTINAITGNFSMTPTALGAYAIAINVEEWRNNSLIGTTIRDMIVDVTSLVSVSEPNPDETAVSIYPNPTNNLLQINFMNEQHTVTKMVIYNATGEVIRSVDLGKKSGVVTHTFDVSALSTGIYFVQVQTKQGSINKKFIKQ